MTLSTCLIVKNSETTLEKCLKSVQDVSDEIIVVIDSSSTDSSDKIAKKFTQKVFVNVFESFAQQRNFVLSKSTSDLILSIDSDEELDKEMSIAIKQLKSSTNIHPVYGLMRKNLMFGKLINHGNWDPNPIPRLWKRNSAKWVGDVHEKLNYSGKVYKINGNLIHHSYTSFEEFISKSNYYTSFETSFKSPFVEFFRRYIWHTGFLDGYAGLFLAYCMCIYSYMTNIKLWEKEQS